MMKKFYLILTCAALCACGNSNAKKQTSDMATTKDIVKESDSIIENNAKTPTIDTNKKYPFKEFILNDLADITYIPIETNNDVLINNGINALSHFWFIRQMRSFYHA